MTGRGPNPRAAAVSDARTIAELLDAFNREFDTPTPGVQVLAPRLERLLAGEHLIALLTGDPPCGLALLSLRPSVWHAGPVATLDELYVVPGRRGNGIGGALLSAAEAAARRRGAESLEINVDGADTGARRFYERHGYTNTDPGQDEPMLYYNRDLNDGRP
jgi:GNAT superfamily N-acetyltransferase